MLAFEGDRLPDWVERRVRDAPVAGVTLFMAVNVLRPHQVRALTEAFQAAGAGQGMGPRPRPGRCSSRPIRRAASSSRSVPRRPSSPATWRSERPMTRP